MIEALVWMGTGAFLALVAAAALWLAIHRGPPDDWSE